MAKTLSPLTHFRTKKMNQIYSQNLSRVLDPRVTLRAKKNSLDTQKHLCIGIQDFRDSLSFLNVFFI